MAIGKELKSFFRALRPIKHDGKTYATGTKVELTEEQANHLGPATVTPHILTIDEMSAADLTRAAKAAKEREGGSEELTPQQKAAATRAANAAAAASGEPEPQTQS